MPLGFVATPRVHENSVDVRGIQDVDPQTLKELLSTFEQAEQAMRAHDIDGIMALYSDDYFYHGLKKVDVQKIWKQLFDYYKELESVHTFSVIRMIGSGSRVWRRNVLHGSSVRHLQGDNTAKLRVDSWYEEIHYLKKENGRWRIVGHAGGESQPVLQFGIAPHPLF